MLFFLGTFAPLLRASERPIAIACFRLFTTPPLPPLPERSVPLFLRCITLLTLLLAAFPYFGILFLLHKFRRYCSKPFSFSNLNRWSHLRLPFAKQGLDWSMSFIYCLLGSFD